MSITAQMRLQTITICCVTTFTITTTRLPFILKTWLYGSFSTSENSRGKITIQIDSGQILVFRKVWHIFTIYVFKFNTCLNTPVLFCFITNSNSGMICNINSFLMRNINSFLVSINSFLFSCLVSINSCLVNINSFLFCNINSFLIRNINSFLVSINSCLVNIYSFLFCNINSFLMRNINSFLVSINSFLSSCLVSSTAA